MNGDAGIQSGSPSLECSGIAGLLKGLYMEQGGKDRDGVTVRIVDFPVDETPETVTGCLLYELTADGFDIESAYVEGVRRVPRLIGENAPEASGPQLFGNRGAGRSVIHPGTVDACLYLCGVCVWLETKGAVGLPKSLKTLRLGRLPKDGENAAAHIRYKHGNESEAWFDVVCCGEDGKALFTLEEYCCRVVPTSVRK